MYRVFHVAWDGLCGHTIKSLCSLFCRGTHKRMSTKYSPRPYGPPCITAISPQVRFWASISLGDVKRFQRNLLIPLRYRHSQLSSHRLVHLPGRSRRLHDEVPLSRGKGASILDVHSGRGEGGPQKADKRN